MSKPDLIDHVETIQLAISQVANPELRDDAMNALTAILKTALEDKMAKAMEVKFREMMEGEIPLNPDFLDTFKRVGEKRGRFKYGDTPVPEWPFKL
jgi:hypothetical protein